jgi:hypothetical protein
VVLSQGWGLANMGKKKNKNKKATAPTASTSPPAPAAAPSVEPPPQVKPVGKCCLESDVVKYASAQGMHGHVHVHCDDLVVT